MTALNQQWTRNWRGWHKSGDKMLVRTKWFKRYTKLTKTWKGEIFKRQKCDCFSHCFQNSFNSSPLQFKSFPRWLFQLSIPIVCLTLSRPGFLSLKLSGETINTPSPCISGTKNQFHIKLSCITKIFLPKWLMMTSSDFQKKVCYFCVFVWVFWFFVLDFAYRLIFFQKCKHRMLLKKLV